MSQFEKDVKDGLSRSPKYLSSKYFYDKKGDELFVQIMNMPEYYLTRAEFEIFKEQTTEIIESLGVRPDSYFELVELGAGDGTKTKELLKVLVNQGFKFDYVPVDISSNALNQLQSSLKEEMEELSVKIRKGDYFEVLESLKFTNTPKVILFLGSNIGNLEDEQAHQFMNELAAVLNSGDKLLLGVDLIKAEEVVLPAYNDKAGITKAFNLNLLSRINNELDANFDIENFTHQPEYSETTGIAKSFLVSTKAQSVKINGSGTFEFKAGEKIHTEISRKYSDEIIVKITKNTKFRLQEKLQDSKGYFADYILVRD
ncbi:L-histidine N(alpha)-methyltransferase [Arcticibacterium luteifluviistationis]|uniref:L-histidine N(Alpha)-methyltransferase n=1 Tax=Arcticibacterium luteifluviistationis TaxID=1784714 RepID=A0A2Z4GFM7_9BACT|nr:L-histidine N(alpha)-methyltransferase [Arcticibacterium luteifluviistationis]AWW00051.1 L-histidine N(alpha)-methyltransferase [Arcticibacterium luteifluviistationis]